MYTGVCQRLLLRPRKNLRCGAEEVRCGEHSRVPARVPEQVGLAYGAGREHRARRRWGACWGLEGGLAGPEGPPVYDGVQALPGRVHFWKLVEISIREQCSSLNAGHSSTQRLISPQQSGIAARTTEQKPSVARKQPACLGNPRAVAASPPCPLRSARP